MSAVTEHLVQAICSLTKAEKVEVIDWLLKDVDFGEILSELPLKKLIGLQGNQRGEYSLILDRNITSFLFPLTP